MEFLPHFPIRVNPVALFGLTLLLGLLGGELANRSRIIPRISGYIAVGFLVGPGGLNIVTPTLLSHARIFLDLSLGLILFDLGRHLDLSWIRHDKGLVRMALAESGLTFFLIFILLFLFNLPWLPAAIGAAIAVATSPAEVMMVAHDLASEGPVTRRTLILTSLNNLIGLTLFSLLLPMTQEDPPLTMGVHAAYRIAGSFLLGILMFYLTIAFGSLIGKRKANQFVLFAGIVIFAIGLARIFNTSSMLTLFTIGVAARNLDKRHTLTQVDFGWLARLFFIILFVITGVQLQLKGFWQVPWIVLTFLFVRYFAKMSGIWLFAKTSRLTSAQSWALTLTLTPMAALAIGMSDSLLHVSPHLGSQLMIIITAVVAVMDIIGPIATQFAFIKTGEAGADTHNQGGLA